MAVSATTPALSGTDLLVGLRSEEPIEAVAARFNLSLISAALLREFWKAEASRPLHVEGCGVG